MNEQTQGKNMAAAAEAAMKAPWRYTASRLCKRLRSMTSMLRQYYQRANQKPRHSPVEEWLCDNYYVLEKECKQSVKDIRQLSRRAACGELERIYKLIETILFAYMPPLGDESVTDILKAAGKAKHISETQFAFVPAAIKAALILMAHDACLKDEQSEEMIRYAIVGLGKLSSIDFDEIIYSCSCIEQVLMRDPAGVYPQMDSDSRKHYRRLIARIACKTRRPEERVALDMLEACAGKQGARSHIGYPILHSGHLRAARRRGRITLACGALLPLLISAALSVLTGSAATGALCFLPLWEILRTPLWQMALAGIDAGFIPRMDPKKITDKPKTVVLVSTLLPGVAQISALADRMKQLYYSNSDPGMYYCVLADFKEWEYPADEKDDSQVAAARKMVEELNREHGNRFMLFLRARTYNKTQRRYSGWERKRGAITEFIRYIKGEKVSLHTFVGDSGVLSRIKYVIALDCDTNLLYESAQTLVCAAIHPLNRPVIQNGAVSDGYGILAPKISPDLESARATAFSRVTSGCGGVTAYETRDKDFYQDLFGESIFAGKGLIDADAFHTLLSDRFPENQILSHDILEGAYLRTAFVSDVEMTDSAPSNMASWLSRLHRWIRGDWQNIKFISRRCRVGSFICDNPIGALSRYKLADNLRRSLTPPASLACMVAALFMPGAGGVVLAVAGVLGVMLPSIWAAFFSLASGGFFTLSRKFFTRTLPHAFELMGQGLFMLIMLPAQSIITLDAVTRSMWRTFVSRKKMLEWTTAAQSEMRVVKLGGLLARFWPAEIFGITYLFLAFRTELSLLGILFALFIPVALISAKPSVEGAARLSGSDREALISYNAAMWRYYEEFAGAENHFLPPDNIQQSPVFRVANRTSPTNIGMMLLSVLAARDFDFIDTHGMYERIERTISAVEKLKTFHGNFINWYDTHTLDTLKPEFVSTVDSGNFICCLVALKEGLCEFAREKPEIHSLIERIEKIIDRCDLTVFYNKKKNLFSIGYDLSGGEMSGSHYDFLLSEARLTSYYAVARKLVGKKHWGAMIRTMSRSGSYAGSVSWTGTMFEYFMPHLLLPVCEGSLLGEALIYCLYCQKKRVKGMGLPWGISESAFYAFDNNLNYQYKAHGVQKIGVKRYLDKELVISPYSTFLTISQNPNSSMRNLRRLHELGVYGHYGFFEAVDFTAGRVGKGGLAVTRSYMAHHIGMSMVASCNALLEGRMQKRFMRNHYMRSANEFLQEKIAKNTVVYDELKDAGDRGEKHERPKIREERRAIYPQAPACTLLSNGEITDVLTDAGAGYLKFGDIDLTRRSTDLLRRAQGIFTLVRMGGCFLSAAQAPFFDRETAYSVEYKEESVTYYAKKKDAEVGVRCLMHPTISCEQRQIAVKNGSGEKRKALILVYFEPVLSAYQDFSAHPAFSKLFVSAKYDEDARVLIFERRGRDSAKSMYLTVGFLQSMSFSYETRRENLMSAPGGLDDLRSFHKKTFSGGGGSLGVPDACCALRFELTLNAGGQGQATLLLCASRTESEGISGIISMRKIGALDSKNAAKSPMLGDSLEGRLGSGILGQLLFHQKGAGDSAAKQENALSPSGLWCAGISGDLPIALVELEESGGLDDAALCDNDLPALESYLRLHASLRGFKVEFDLVILYAQGSRRDALIELIRKNSIPALLGVRGGVFLLHKAVTPPEVLTLLRAMARHVFYGGQPLGGVEKIAQFRPAELLPLTPEPMPQNPEHRVNGGAFDGGRFYADKNSPLPWCHVLSNPSFGTLVSDSALGYTWAVNSRENKLTPWYNDICADNTGELLLFNDGGRIFNLTHGARASFSGGDARYQGRNTNIASTVTVTVSERGCAKYVDVALQNRTDAPLKGKLAYYLEPVLAVSRDSAHGISAALRGGVLVLRNSCGMARSYAALSAPGRAGLRFTNDRAAFLCGDWSENGLRPENDPCAAAVVPVEIPARGEESVRFVLAWGGTEKSAAYMVLNDLGRPAEKRENILSVQTPEQGLNQFVNYFCAHQIISSRLFGRTAFYQCGGAYGFRDQLQDAMACQLLRPDILRRQIIRCCSVQFEEGDVLHWWHRLPGRDGIKGVRTLFSDDLLWLPLAVSEYVSKTGDKSILDVPVFYLSAAELNPGEHEKYISPRRGDVREDVFGHCTRAIERGYKLGEGGLPLIGCGDWCDGFSSVGLEGKGRSIWLALFLVMVLEGFASVCELRGDNVLAGKCRERAADLRRAADEHCWDGGWYLRAFFDNGEKMGSSVNEECFIDLLPQSFAVLANMPDAKRVALGLDNALAHLFDGKRRLVKLFEKPFKDSRQQPGYVKAYPAGIRENGGQYTHAAVWFAIALLRFGKTDEGWEVLKMLCPADRAAHPELSGQYKLEPYYIAADIYSGSAVPGRGGWSVYTGAAAWYLRAVYEELLGLRLTGDKLSFAPRLPAGWDKAAMKAEIRGCKLDVTFIRGKRPALFLDGKPAESVPLKAGEYAVRVEFT